MKTKLIFLLLTATLVCSLLVGCSLGGGNTENGSSGILLPSFWDFYHYFPEDTSYAKVELVNLHDDIYNLHAPDVQKPEVGRFMIAECKVQEDYYGTLSAGTLIYVTVYLPFNDNEEIEFEDKVSVATDILTNSDSLLIYLERKRSNFRYYRDGEQEPIISPSDDLVYYADLDEYNIIPINEGRLQLSRIDGMWDTLGIELGNIYKEYLVRYKAEYGDYFRDGMTEKELRESLKRHYEHEKENYDLLMLSDFYLFSEGTPFSLFKVCNVVDDIYGGGPWRYLIVECEIVESYAGSLVAGDKFNWVVSVLPKNSRSDIDEDQITAVKEYLLGQDGFFGVVLLPLDDQKKHYSIDGTLFESELPTSSIIYWPEEGLCLPVNEGKLDFEPLEQYIKDFIASDGEIEVITYDGIENYLQDGMTKDELKVSIEKLVEDMNNAF